LFKECMHSNIHVYCSHGGMSEEEEQGRGNDDEEQSDFDEDRSKEIGSVECGWLTMVDKKTDASEVCRDL